MYTHKLYFSFLKNNPLLIFETKRLAVRRYTSADADDFFRFSGNEEVMRFIRPVISRPESDKFLQANIQLYTAQPNTGRWAVFEKAMGGYIGSFSILVMEGEVNKLHIGYALLPEYWGRGYASELLKTGMHYFFDNHRADELFAITEIPNTASQNVLLKAGFRQTGVLHEGTHRAWVYSFARKELPVYE